VEGGGKKITGFWYWATKSRCDLCDQSIEIDFLVDFIWGLMTQGEQSSWHVLDFSPFEQIDEEINLRSLALH